MSSAAFYQRHLGPKTKRLQQPATLTQAFPTRQRRGSYILDTFPLVKRKDKAQFNGDYRTKRTNLEIYNALTPCKPASPIKPASIRPPPTKHATHAQGAFLKPPVTC